MKELKLILVGFGNVGKALARLLDAKQSVLSKDFGFTTRIIGIATGNHGIALDQKGIDWKMAIQLVNSGQSIISLSANPAPESVFNLIRYSGADILFENSPVNHHTGQPAADYLVEALQAGMHAITANKGPVVHAHEKLTRLAAQKNRRFLFESAVMDGAPIFSLFRGPLPAVELRGFSGILNSCTNLLIELMEQGRSFEEAVEYGRSIGITETDPSADIDGWDAAIKVSALCTVLMGIPLKPDQVQREGIRKLTREMIQSALYDGKRWKLVCTARKNGEELTARVAPQQIDPTNPLFSVNGTSSFVQFETDALPGLGILETNPGPETTAYGLLADLINAIRER